MVLMAAAAAFGQTGPEAVVKRLYTAHDGNRSPFFQTKSRARVDMYFTKGFGDLIWKDVKETRKGEVGTLDFDPLYNAQDTDIKRLKVGKPAYGEGNLDVADVEVTFTNFKEPRMVLFRLERGKNGKWLIDNISYPKDGFSLRSLYAENAALPPDGAMDITGQLHKEKTRSYIFYVGPETGDFAAFCFANDSKAGRAILEKCKNGDQCSVKGEVADGNCKPKGVEGLSASGTIVKVDSVSVDGKRN